MTTTIDNNQRVFMLIGDYNITIFCNLKGIPDAVASFNDKSTIKIKHCWNNQFKTAPKKMLNEMFAGHDMPFRLK